MKEYQEYKLGEMKLKLKTRNLIVAGVILLALVAYGLGRDSGYKDGYAGAYKQCYDNMRPQLNSQRPDIWELAVLFIAGGAGMGMTLHGMPFTSQSSTVITSDDVLLEEGVHLTFGKKKKKK